MRICLLTVVAGLMCWSGASTALAQPVNDDCLGAIPFVCGDLVSGDTSTATGPDNGSLFCGTSNTGAPGIWYSFVGTGDNVTLSTCNSAAYDTKIQVWLLGGTFDCSVPGDLTCVAGNDDAGGCAGFTSELSFGSIAGETYYILVYGFGTATGTFDMSVTCTVPAGNDACAGAIPAVVGSNAFDNSTASLDGPLCDPNMDADVWFTFTATVDEFHQVDMCASGFDGVLGVYEGDTSVCGAWGPSVACGDDDCGLAPIANWFAIAGTTYLIQVGGWNGATTATGSFDLIISGPEDCFDGLDNDLDGLTDCADPDCAAEPSCQEAGNCFDGIDNDADGLTDCADPDCQLTEPACDESTQCFDGIDNDLDGLTDCADPDCQLVEASCNEGLNCTDGIDNDLDGSIDCMDMDCTGDPACVEICDNGIDDDFDGAVDCADDFDCEADALCIGTYLPGDTCGTRLAVVLGANPYNTVGLTNSTDPRDQGSCFNAFGQQSSDIWLSYIAGVDGVAFADTCDAASFDTDMTVYELTAGDCATKTQVVCNGDGIGLGGCQIFYSAVQFPVVAGTEYVIRIGGFGAATAGAGTLNLSEVMPTADEIGLCFDGLDNDLDGLIDCADDDCSTTEPFCDESLNCGDGIDNDLDGLIDCADFLDCVPGTGTCPAAPTNDECTGAIPVICGDLVTADTSLAFPDVQPFCGTSDGTGGGVWYSFTGTGDDVSFSTCSATVQYDTKIRVYEGDCMTLVCVAGNDDNCTGGSSGLLSTVNITSVVGVEYFILVHGFAGGQGVFEMTVTCAGPEICDDGIDNDLDGLTDCEDTVDCPLGTPPCLPPVNDECAGALPAVLGPNGYDTTLASNSGTGPLNCPTTGFPGQMDNDIWFTYTATVSSSIVAETCGTGHDTDIAIFEGDCLNLVQVGCSGDDCGLQSRAVASTTAGTTYTIQLGSWGAGATFAGGTLTISEGAPEDCTNGIDDDLDGLADCADLDDCGCDAACPNDFPITGLSVTSVCNTGAVDLAWDADNAMSYDVFRDGVLVGTTMTNSFTETGVADGTYLYDVVGTCGQGGIVAPPVGQTVVVASGGGFSDTIYAQEGAAGLVDSVTALQNALIAAGKTVQVLAVQPETDPCGGVSERVWYMGGTFPEFNELTAGSETNLVAWQAAGVGVYVECGDQWGFTGTFGIFGAIDGIDEGATADGDDTFLSMDGADALFGNLLLSSFQDVAYTQDNAGNDWTDQLVVSTTDSLGPESSAVWSEGASNAYVTGTLYVPNNGGSNVLCQSWEFGGFGGDQNALALLYIDALGGTPPGSQFIRGDCNSDLGFNIADAIYTLAALFSGGPPGACLEACDANSDASINIADAIYALAALFSGGPPPSAPHPTCGVGTGALSCDVSPCP